MRITAFFRNLVFTAFLAGALAAGSIATAHAQSTPTPHQIQAQIAAGQNATALSELQTVLQAHPDSGVAWYLSAEAQDASGNTAAARAALAKADQYAPGLPFANQNDVAQLRAHLAGPAASAARTGSGISPIFLVLGALVVLFLIFRLFSRARQNGMGYQGGFRPGYPAPPQYPNGPGGMPYGPGGGVAGSGIGGALLGGLAAGAGLAAGERIIDGMMGGNRGDSSFGQGGGVDPTPVPDRDDGLLGSPGWDDGSSGIDNSGGSDSNDSW
jgi:hypothetical protein